MLVYKIAMHIDSFDLTVLLHLAVITSVACCVVHTRSFTDWGASECPYLIHNYKAFVLVACNCSINLVLVSKDMPMPFWLKIIIWHGTEDNKPLL